MTSSLSPAHSSTYKAIVASIRDRFTGFCDSDQIDIRPTLYSRAFLMIKYAPADSILSKLLTQLNC